MATYSTCKLVYHYSRSTEDPHAQYMCLGIADANNAWRVLLSNSKEVSMRDKVKFSLAPRSE